MDSFWCDNFFIVHQYFIFSFLMVVYTLNILDIRNILIDYLGWNFCRYIKYVFRFFVVVSDFFI